MRNIFLSRFTGNGNRSVLTLGSLCLHCCVRDTTWSWFKNIWILLLLNINHYLDIPCIKKLCRTFIINFLRNRMVLASTVRYMQTWCIFNVHHPSYCIDFVRNNSTFLLSDEREDVQKKTFAKWINSQLAKVRLIFFYFIFKDKSYAVSRIWQGRQMGWIFFLILTYTIDLWSVPFVIFTFLFNIFFL